jgi:hypothetical protein
MFDERRVITNRPGAAPRYYRIGKVMPSLGCAYGYTVWRWILEGSTQYPALCALLHGSKPWLRDTGRAIESP